MTTLEDAREILNNGWMKGHYTDGLGNYCIVGALSMAYTHGQQCDYVPIALQRKLTKHLSDVGWVGGTQCLDKCAEVRRGDSCTHLPHFNDDESTTKSDVLALFDKAIASE